MGRFGDEIKKKLDNGNIEYSSSSWAQMDKKLSEKTSYTEFEQKIQNTLSTGAASVPQESWKKFSENSNLLNKFENNLSEKLNNGEINTSENTWEDFSEKLNNSNLTSYEKTIKQVLNSEKFAYKHNHWKAFEKLLYANKAKKTLWRGAAIILLLFSTGIGIDQFFNKESNTFKEVNITKKNSLAGDNTVNVNEQKKQKSNIKPSDLSIQYLDEGSIEKNVFNRSIKPNQDYQENVVYTKDDFNEKLSLLPSIAIAVKKSIFSPIELIKHQTPNKVKPKITNHLHPGASLWLNFWDNPSLTGFYGKNTISGFYFNDWEIIDENKDQTGEFNFVQPLVRIGAYERRLNNNWAIGGFLNYQLKKNWNIHEYCATISYTKQLINGYDFRFGAGATFRSQNLAVNKLTLREKAINSNYIFTTELGSLKSKNEFSSTYHIGGFINNKNFFLGYTTLNFKSNHFTNDNDIILVKHCIISGVHSPSYKNFKASGLFKFEKELFNYYSPAIGLTYDEKLFAMYEYKNLSGQKLSLGYQMKNGIKAQFNYNIDNLELYQKQELNLDNFTERKGYISAGLNYIF